MSNENMYILPNPIVDSKEQDSIVQLTKRYEKLREPSVLSQAGEKVLELLPKGIIEFGNSSKKIIREKELYTQAMEVIGKGFKEVEAQAAKFSVSEKMIIDEINAVSKDNKIYTIEEICLKRGYDISKAVNEYKTNDFWIAFAEGAVTGIFGFAGLPFNIVLSTLLYYRAVQSIAMYYGYDIKNDSSEMVIASKVFMNALSPESKDCGEITNIISKVMLISKVETVKQTVKKGWTEMASRGGTELFLTQIRALANKSAQKALKNAGQKGIENSIFKDVFGQIGKRLTQKVISKSIPVVSGVIGALFDSVQMKEVLEYADVFYNKRFLLEKEQRINMLMNKTENIIDVEFDENTDEINLSDKENETYRKLPDPEKLKEILLIQSALDIIMQDEEKSWLRLVNFYKEYNQGVDMVKFDNGAGDTMYILFSESGVIIKGFDHESILSPYNNEEEKIAKGIYDFTPNELMELLKDESIEINDVTFCIWRSQNDSNWQKGTVEVLEDYKEDDDGEGFLLGFIFEDAEEWLDWAKDYYDKEIPIECVKNIYEHVNITKEIIQKINPGRDVDNAIRELKDIGYLL